MKNNVFYVGDSKSPNYDFPCEHYVLANRQTWCTASLLADIYDGLQRVFGREWDMWFTESTQIALHIWSCDLELATVVRRQNSDDEDLAELLIYRDHDLVSRGSGKVMYDRVAQSIAEHTEIPLAIPYHAQLQMCPWEHDPGGVAEPGFFDETNWSSDMSIPLWNQQHWIYNLCSSNAANTDVGAKVLSIVKKEMDGTDDEINSIVVHIWVNGTEVLQVKNCFNSHSTVSFSEQFRDYVENENLREKVNALVSSYIDEEYRDEYEDEYEADEEDV